MDNESDPDKDTLAKPLAPGGSVTRVLYIVLGVALILGLTTGYILANKQPSSITKIANQAPKAAQQDTQTFRDFSEGVIKPKPTPKDPSEYSEGTHILERDRQTPVALTSSVVDLSQYEGKKVKVYGETQKALKEGWLMDVGKIEEIK